MHLLILLITCWLVVHVVASLSRRVSKILSFWTLLQLIRDIVSRRPRQSVAAAIWLSVEVVSAAILDQQIQRISHTMHKHTIQAPDRTLVPNRIHRYRRLHSYLCVHFGAKSGLVPGS